MSGVIKIDELTVEQMREFKGIKLPAEMNKFINVNTYYRILKKDFKFGPQNESLKKLAKAFGVTVEVLKKQIENQYKKDGLSIKNK